jgi:hypothetical protein
MPSSQIDGLVYSKYRKELEELGATPVISDVKSLQACIDKALTFQMLTGMSDISHSRQLSVRRLRNFQ